LILQRETLLSMKISTDSIVGCWGNNPRWMMIFHCIYFQIRLLQSKRRRKRWNRSYSLLLLMASHTHTLRWSDNDTQGEKKVWNRRHKEKEKDGKKKFDDDVYRGDSFTTKFQCVLFVPTLSASSFLIASYISTYKERRKKRIDIQYLVWQPSLDDLEYEKN
jgi:hypothetical protein